MPEERIEKTVLATQDIEQLTAYYQAEAGIVVALRFVDNAERAFVQLAQMPRMGALLGFLHAPHVGIRRWHIKGFPRLLILYREIPCGIEVVRVVDAGRDINALFDDPDFPSTYAPPAALRLHVRVHPACITHIVSERPPTTAFGCIVHRDPRRWRAGACLTGIHGLRPGSRHSPPRATRSSAQASLPQISPNLMPWQACNSLRSLNHFQSQIP